MSVMNNYQFHSVKSNLFLNFLNIIWPRLSKVIIVSFQSLVGSHKSFLNSVSPQQTLQATLSVSTFRNRKVALNSLKSFDKSSKQILHHRQLSSLLSYTFLFWNNFKMHPRMCSRIIRSRDNKSNYEKSEIPCLMNNIAFELTVDGKYSAF